MTPDAAYTRQLLRVFGAGLAVIMAINIAMDPFGIYRKWHLPHLRTEPVTWSRVSAAERIAADCQVVLLGSSRVVHGFGPHLPKWGNRTACNGAVAGTGIQEQRAIFDFVLKQRDVRTVMLYLDFHLFHSDRSTKGDFDQSRFNADRTRLAYNLWATTSLDAFRSGMRVIGQPLPWLDADQPPPVGQLRANKIELLRFLRNEKLYGGWQGDKETMDILRSMLADADRKGIRTFIVIPPVHAMLLETEQMTGVWKANKAWKRELVKVAGEARRDVQVWDFSTYSAPVMSPMPLVWEDPLNPWWVDVSHQSRQLGFMTLDRIADAEAGVDEGKWDRDFGVLLTPDNLERHLSRVDRGREAWREAYPDQLAWLEAEAQALLSAEISDDVDMNAVEPGQFRPDLPGEEAP